jgi:hypothetical protein
MNNQNIKIGVQIESNTAKETTQAERLGAALKDAANSAQKIKVPAGSTTGVGSVMAKSAPVGAQAVMQYGAQRGTAGATGAAARDFAAQSQQLGGLVRIYATYAANVYAAGAAFRALSQAMDTTNMIKGLDQLSASSGKSLGGLSKQFQQVTGGAISMREAIEATVKASSSGLAGADILRLGTVAQKASVALGVNMSDAVSRLSRGITKLEPELLDELGIFTKIEPAVEKYARSVGKAAGQLTDFERRQAFATAVLAEAEEKFGRIEIDANPYNKLAANFSNLLQKSLELVNLGLTPIVKILNSNPAVLATAVGLLGASILKNVIPQLADLKKGLDSVATSRANIAKTKRDEGLANLLPKIVDSRAEIDKRNDDFYKQYESGREKLIRRLQSTGPIDPKALQILGKVPGEISAEDEKYVQGKLRRRKADREAFQEYTTGVKGAAQTDQELLKNSEKIAETVNKRKSIFTALGRAQADVDAAYKASVRSNIVSEAARTASADGLWKALTNVFTATREAGKDKTLQTTLEGTTASGKKFTQNIKETLPGLGLFQQLGTGAAGVAAALGTAIAGIGRALLRLVPYIGIIIAGFELVKSIWSTSDKEAEAFSQSTDVLKSAITNVDNTLESISKKKPGEIFTIDTIKAQATALNELSTSFSDLATKADKLSKARSGFDKFTDGAYEAVEKIPGVGRIITTVFGDSKKTDLAKSIADSVSQSLRLIESGPERDKLEKEYAKALGVDPTALVDKKKLEESLKGANFDELTKSAGRAADVQKKFSTETNISVSKLDGLKTSLSQTVKEVDSFLQGLAPTDPFAKIGVTLLDNGNKIREALNEPKNSILALQEIANNFKALALLPPDVSDQLMAAKGQIKSFVDEIDVIKGTIARLDQDLEKAQKAGDDRRIQSLQKALDTERASLQKSQSAATQFAQKFTETLQKGFFEAGMKNLEIASKFAAQKGAITAERGGLSVLSEAGVSTAAQEMRLKDREYAIQKTLIDSQVALAISTEGLRAETALNNALQELNNKALDRAKAQVEKGLGSQEVKDLDEKIAKLAEAIPRLTAVTTLIKSGKATTTPGIQSIQRGGTDVEKSILGGELANLVSAVYARDQKVKEMQGQQASDVVQGRSKLLTEQTAPGARALEQQSIADQRALEELQRREQILGVYNQELATQRRKAEFTAIDSKLAKENYELGVQLSRTGLTEIKNEAQRLEVAKRQTELTRQIAENNKRAGEDKTKITRQGIFEELNADKAKLQRVQDNESKLRELAVQRQNLELEASERSLQILGSIEGINQSILITEKARIDVTRAQQEADTQSLAITQRQNQLKLEQREIDAKKAIGLDVSVLQSSLDFEQQRLADQKTLIDSTLVSKTANIELTKRLAIEQDAYNKKLELATNLANSFSTIFENIGDDVASAFEKMGKGIGGVVIAMTEMGVQSEKNAAAQKKLSKELSAAEEGDDVEKLLALRKQQGELQKKTQKDEISGYAKSIGAAKNMFKEKSGAYKILAAMEKAMYIAKLAMDIKEFAIKTGLLQAEVAATAATQGQIAAVENAGFMARLPKMITGIFGKFLELLGPWGMAAAGVAIAAIGLSSSGGGKPKNFVPSAEQRQETQGTAMSWDTTQAYGSEGKKIQTREGVFGDTSAKSESIANSLEIIKNNSVAGLSYNDSLLKSLEKLNKTMGDAAKAIYGLKGVASGTAFGNKEFTKSKSGFLGIGGKDVTQEISDSGVKLQGTFLELAQKGGGVIQQFETLTTTTKKKGFLGIGGSTRIDVTTKYKDLDPKAAEAINGAFNEGYQTIMTAAAESGIKELTPARVNEILGGVKVDEIASLRGLKGEELQTQLNAVIGSVLDDAAGATFEQFKQFREFGEGMFETAVRVVDTNKKVKQVLTNLSASVQNIDFAMSEQMVEMAGGLEAFIEQSDSFSENFLTEEERLAPKKKAVRDELGRLGLSWVTTRKQFKDVVQSLIDSGQAGSQTYADLMKLNAGFAEVTPEIENLSKSLEELKNDLKSTAEQRITDLKSARDGFEQFSKSIRDYQQSLKTGALSPLTPGQKYLENKRQFEQLSALAKTDTKEGADARGKLQGAASSLLESSRTMFASSDAYTQDFGSVQAALDDAAAYGDEQVKKANESIDLVKQQVQGIVDLKDSVDRLPEPISAGVGSAVTTALANFRTASDPEAQKAAEAAKNQRDQMAVSYAAQIAASEALKRAADAFAAAGNNYSSVTSGYTAAATTGSGSILNAQPDAATWFSGQNWYMETGATGSNYIPEDMPLYVHQGERLMPAADNKQLMKMVSDYSGGGGGELYDEVCRLTKQVEVLTKVVADGAIVNAQATDRNTDELTKTFQDISEKAAYVDKLKNRTSIV